MTHLYIISIYSVQTTSTCYAPKHKKKHIIGGNGYAVIQALMLIPSGKQAMVDKKVMTTSQTDGNVSIVHSVQYVFAPHLGSTII